jgi:hypothetical protein
VDRVIRPKAVVLPDSALVFERQTISPPPNQFTHEVVVEQPYYEIDADDSAAAAGQFQSGSKLVLLRHDDGPMCHVADARGHVVKTAFEGLRPCR